MSLQTQELSNETATTHPLDAMFHPRSTASVGVSSRPDAASTSFLGAFLDQGYAKTHALYPVNPKLTEVGELKAYTTVLDCPDPVDHVISQAPAHAVLDLVNQCIEKRVRTVHVYTAGFSETEDAELTALEG